MWQKCGSSPLIKQKFHNTLHFSPTQREMVPAFHHLGLQHLQLDHLSFFLDWDFWVPVQSLYFSCTWTERISYNLYWACMHSPQKSCVPENRQSLQFSRASFLPPFIEVVSPNLFFAYMLRCNNSRENRVCSCVLFHRILTFALKREMLRHMSLHAGE